ncbi:DUF3592 domain-containing protein [Saccharomonospora xinjiangensis]|uniref:DUF3592 domain-containing protein n=1 Tax=Saccharomonospora xinjiangensis TaxID=75294 RepID=UPI00106FE8AF|nr:DUF3592 domain-containing protein [Saccharomonospora xinjiangensis]QBQ58739.1 hypothetical protein EYD13_01760 [Saccharomonospora xinjiangensis]
MNIVGPGLARTAQAPESRRDHALRLGFLGVLGVASVITLLGVVLVLGAFRNDQVIAEHHGTATALVEQTTFDRTLIRYETPDGVSHSPENGVLYPDGLSEGQLVRIEYDTTDPALAKVAERTWLLTLLPVTTTLLFTWLVAAPLLWGLRSRLRARTAAPVAA